MKRYLCPNHMHVLKVEGKSVKLSSENCSICRYEKRPKTLKDLARIFEALGESLRIAHDDLDYDPFGYSYVTLFEEGVVQFLKSTHKDYRQSMLDRINKAVDSKQDNHLHTYRNCVTLLIWSHWLKFQKKGE